jgi:hypothetical protein
MGLGKSKLRGPEPLKSTYPSSLTTDRYVEQLQLNRLNHLESKIDESAATMEVNHVESSDLEMASLFKMPDCLS